MTEFAEHIEGHKNANAGAKIVILSLESDKDITCFPAC